MTVRRQIDDSVVPVVLFAYNRRDTLAQTLEGLRMNAVPLLIVYSDGPKDAGDRMRVADVRALLRKVDWCAIKVVESVRNLGLGTAILSGVSDVLKEWESVIVFEDDIVCIPGTYEYMCQALRCFQNETKVMSISAWNHSRLQPTTRPEEGYFDGRFACWGWGTWQRAWRGMETEAKRLLRDCKRQKKDILRHGSDLEFMAKSERAKNIWAVRFALLHILRDGLCFHPPYSLVKNIGFGLAASNTRDATWDDPELPRSQAPVFTPPSPPVVETEGVAALWRKAIGEPERWTLIMRLRNARWRLAWLIRALVTRWRKNPSSLKS